MRRAVALALLSLLSDCMPQQSPVAVSLDAIPSSDWLVVWVVMHRGVFLSREPRLCQEREGKLHCRPLCGPGTDLDCPYQLEKTCTEPAPQSNSSMATAPGSNSSGNAADGACLADRDKPRNVLRAFSLLETPDRTPKALSLFERKGKDDKVQGLWLRLCSLVNDRPTNCIDTAIASAIGDDQVVGAEWTMFAGKLNRGTLTYLQIHDDRTFQHVFECTAGDDNRLSCEHLQQLERVAGLGAGTAEPPALAPRIVQAPAPAVVAPAASTTPAADTPAPAADTPAPPPDADGAAGR